MTKNTSYVCPVCGNILCADDWCVNLIPHIDINCPICGNTFKGCRLKSLATVATDFVIFGPGSSKNDIGGESHEPHKNIVQKKSKSSDSHTPAKSGNIDGGNNVTFDMVGFTITENYLDEAGTPGEKGVFYEVSADRTIVGRKSNSSTADIQIPSNRYMSRQHALIIKEKDGYRIKWVGKTNALTVNDIPVMDENGAILRDGDKITMGQCVAIWRQEIVDHERSICLIQ